MAEVKFDSVDLTLTLDDFQALIDKASKQFEFHSWLHKKYPNSRGFSKKRLRSEMDIYMAERRG